MSLATICKPVGEIEGRLGLKDAGVGVIGVGVSVLMAVGELIGVDVGERWICPCICSFVGVADGIGVLGMVDVAGGSVLSVGVT